MSNLSVQYLGLQLRNPLIVSSSSLTNSVEKVQQCAAAGAGAVVLKSLFEEEIEAEIHATAGDSPEHAEALDYFRGMQTAAGLTRYTTLIRDAKAAVDIPVIASINAVGRDWWVEHVVQLERAGADALELNISLMPYDYRQNDDKVMDFYIGTVQAVRKVVKLPIAVKIGPQFSSLPALVDKLHWAGAKAVVLFNRFYQLDIDIQSMALKSGSPFSTPADLSLPLRWITLLSGRYEVELAASSGVHSAEDAVKVLLAGAQAVQVCSTLYKNGMAHIGTMSNGMASWMHAHQFDSIEDFRGRLSQKRSDRPETFERLQYIRALVGRD